MDGQQFRGVHVFSVLPAQLSDLQTFDELLMLADELATRLDGAVLDDTGGPLTVERIDELRQALFDGAAAPPDDAGGP
jgi:FtsZ-interacting cell division protein ZipA